MNKKILSRYAPFLTWALLLTLICATAFYTSELKGLDLRVYQAGARLFLLNPDDLYTPGLKVEGSNSLPFTYPPFAAFLFVPLGVLPFPWALGVMTALSLILLYAIMRDLSTRLKNLYPTLPAWVCSPLLLTGAFSLLTPFRETLGFGQINIIIFATVYFCCVRWGFSFISGVVIGLFGGIKLTPLALGIIPLAYRKFSMIAGMAVGFSGSILLMFLLTPKLSMTYWTQVIKDPSRIGDLGYFDNISLRGSLVRLGVDSSSVWAFLSFALIVAAFYLLVCLRDRIDIPSALGIAGALMLLISPVSWTHHATWLPLIMYSLLCMMSLGRRKKILPVVSLGLFLLAFAVGVRVYLLPLVRFPNDADLSSPWVWITFLPALSLLLYFFAMLWAQSSWKRESNIDSPHGYELRSGS